MDLTSLIREIHSLPVVSFHPEELTAPNPLAFPPAKALREEAYVATFKIGIQFPILVTKNKVIVDGIKRWLGALHWRLTTIPCKVFDCELCPGEIAAISTFLNDPKRIPAKAAQEEMAPYRIEIEFDPLVNAVTKTKRRLWMRAVEQGMIKRTGKHARAKLEGEFVQLGAKLLNSHLAIEELCELFDQPPEPLLSCLESSSKAMSEFGRMLCSFSERVFHKIDGISAIDTEQDQLSLVVES